MTSDPSRAQRRIRPAGSDESPLTSHSEVLENGKCKQTQNTHTVTPEPSSKEAIQHPVSWGQ